MTTQEILDTIRNSTVPVEVYVNYNGNKHAEKHMGYFLAGCYTSDLNTFAFEQDIAVTRRLIQRRTTRPKPIPNPNAAHVIGDGNVVRRGCVDNS